MEPTALAGLAANHSRLRPRYARRFVASLLIASFTLAGASHSVQAQETAEANSTVRERLVADVKAYFTAPLRWDDHDWLAFGGTVAAITVAHQHDEDVRSHFDTRISSPGEHKDYDLHDALPAAAAFAGTWLYATVSDSDAGRQEAGTMLEAAGLGITTAYALKLATGRERPFETADSSQWRAGGEAFPSVHVTAAFAIGTVLAESGNDNYRWIRRVLGYGLAFGTAYERLDHGNHWLSDTVAGAALGIATAKFVMHRRKLEEDRTALSIIPLNGGLMLNYTVAFNP